MHSFKSKLESWKAKVEGRPPMPPPVPPHPNQSSSNASQAPPPVPPHPNQPNRPSAPVKGSILTPISRDEPLGQFARRKHPLTPPVDGDYAVPTNKFYTNMLLDNRTLPAWTHPYSVWWSQAQDYWGLAISQTTAEQRVFGPDPAQVPTQYYLNPAGIVSTLLGAREFAGNKVSVQPKQADHLSVTLDFAALNGSGTMSVPLTMGMGFVSAIYNNITPVIQSQVGIASANKLPCNAGLDKYELNLFNGVRWLVYTTGGANFRLENPNNFVCDGPFRGLVQVGSCPAACDQYFDSAAGAYASSASLEAGQTEDGSTGTYKIVYNIEGRSSSGKILAYALPHHVNAFSDACRSTMTPAKLDSTVMGPMVGCITQELEMCESLPRDVGFLPWARFHAQDDGQFGSGPYDDNLRQLMRSVAAEELQQDIKGQSCLDSMYFSGKGLDKFAFILLVTKLILNDDQLTKQGLEKLKDAFNVFATNHQQNPLVYDTTWKGLVSIAGVDGDPNADFGNSFFNDHHFHYGYFIHCAAVIALIDESYGGKWLEQNRAFVDNLVRDVANPSHDDPYFPVFRSFDWFSGHSWAKGLFLSGDGKDEESSSEDYHFAYGMKLWGKVCGDPAMEARGNLMIAIMNRSMNLYMLFADDNPIVPKQIHGNRVSGILFENKVDHATYFGLNPEYIQGIHMIPITPISSFIRSPEFVQQEWNSIVASIIDKVDDGWKGILKLNQALYDPKASLSFFASPSFKPQWLDPGMSRTWAIAYAGGISR
uniref:glucan endo-1,3-beta-D-glucosidase n=1 Tax=Blastobotrys adeninivorans TaxID=409370 RepID=A0A060TAI1_BLAAD